VPSVNGSTHVDGTPAKYYENWQQGVAVITIEDDVPYVELIEIRNGVAWFRGKKFVSQRS
jgi:hypothetical protein